MKIKKMGRTMKHNGFNANRGFKQLAGVARRAHKFIKGAPEYIRKIDNYAGRGADVLTKGGQVLSLAGAVTGNEGLMHTGIKWSLPEGLFRITEAKPIVWPT